MEIRGTKWNTVNLDRLAAIKPNPKWSDEQKSQALEITSAAARLSDATKKFQAAELKLSEAKRRSAGRADLNADIAALEREQESAKAKRDEAKTTFQSADQANTQAMNILSAVVRTTNEVRGIGAGSRSGL